MNGMDLIRAERARQISAEGYLPEHDDAHTRGELAQAAMCYRHAGYAAAVDQSFVPALDWPWEPNQWKPSASAVRNLVKAGALYLAESERHTRMDNPFNASLSLGFAGCCAADIDKLLAREKPTFKSNMNKHLKYLSYVVRHKWFVLLACIEHGIFWRGVVHDWSKFLPSEWRPYAEFFYGRGAQLRAKKKRTQYLTPDELTELTTIERAFDRAWLSHQHRSPHHWQHHILREDNGNTKLLAMSKADATEMVCDWMGAGRAITGRKGTTLDWYLRNRDKMALPYEIKAYVEHLLQVPDQHRFVNARTHNGCSPE